MRHLPAASAVLVVALCGTGWGQDAADADRDHQAAPDLCNGLIDPYNPVDEQLRFYQAAGADGELDAREFAANLGQANAFVRKFDRWQTLATFDRTGNGRIGWFEADAYRKAIRTRVLATFDADQDGQLLAAEREAANRALAAGQLTPVAAATRPAGATTRAASSASLARLRHADLVKQFDADGDGRLDEAERRVLRQALRKAQQRYELLRFDVDGNGTLSAAERPALEAYRARRRRWVARFDKNGDGFLLADEQRAAREAMDEQRRKELVTRYDADGDGKLGKAEWAACRADVERRIAEHQAKQELARFDVNRDGRLDDDERRALSGWREAQDKARKQRLRQYDTDGDGELSEAERRAMLSSSGSDEPSGADEGRAEVGDEGWVDPTDLDPDASYLERLLHKYDADGDGRLDTDERARMWREQYYKALSPGDDKSNKRE